MVAIAPRAKEERLQSACGKVREKRWRKVHRKFPCVKTPLCTHMPLLFTTAVKDAQRILTMWKQPMLSLSFPLPTFISFSVTTSLEHINIYLKLGCFWSSVQHLTNTELHVLPIHLLWGDHKKLLVFSILNNMVIMHKLGPYTAYSQFQFTGEQINSNGPNTGPCETLLLTSLHYTNCQFTPTFCFLDFNKSLIHKRTYPRTHDY